MPIPPPASSVQVAFRDGSVPLPEATWIRRHLAHTVWQLQRLPEAEALLRAGLDELPDDQALLRSEVAADLGYATFLQGRYREAERILRPTLDTQRRLLGDRQVSTLVTMRFLASSLRGPASLTEAERLDG